MDEVDDLTRFLDEDFGTEDVNLFEFTSEQDSPLTQLKSVILSLDWEISDETLHDLTEEINHLKHLEQFENDKVSQVYLQGLDKIGHYVQAEGAYAHPNALKLLLTLYYDFEKILSSEHITGAEITALLKADVRKFKILQHQIAQKHGTTAATEEVASPLPLTEHKDLQGIQAAILELDWEVTDNGLNNLGEQLNILKDQYADDRYIQVIIQGLHSLKSYILEERGRAHPETFSLLHNFYDALEALVESPDLEEEKRQDILIDSVNRLNNLKNLIAQTYPKEVVEPEAISPVPEEGVPAEEELGLAPEPAGATEEKFVPEPEEPAAEIAAPPAPSPEKVVAPAPTSEEDLDEIGLFGTDMDEHRELAPALSDSMEETGLTFAGAEETPPDELTEKLDFFFGEEKTEFEPETIERAVAQKAEEQVVEVPETPAVFEEDIAPALAGSFEERGFGAEGEDQQAPTQELADKLDFFFGDEAEKPVAEEFPPAAASAEPEEMPTISFDAEPDEVPAAYEGETVAPALTGLEEEMIAPALADFDTEEITPALADQEAESGFGGRDEQAEAPPEELAEKLDFFFGPDEVKEQVPTEVAPEKIIEVAPAFAEEPTITFAAEPEEEGPLTFMPEDEEEVLLTPALAAATEEEIPSFEEITTPAQYQEALQQMRTEFKEMEAVLREQIESLRQDVQSLRARLG
ncbi:MAG: hypothetical protein C4563_02880 [Desulfobulbus sp.]|nr:MAG: hypothetical protein C4563_02880 [Desulfobulbus sp.]